MSNNLILKRPNQIYTVKQMSIHTNCSPISYDVNEQLNAQEVGHLEYYQHTNNWDWSSRGSSGAAQSNANWTNGRAARANACRSLVRRGVVGTRALIPVSISGSWPMSIRSIIARVDRLVAHPTTRCNAPLWLYQHNHINIYSFDIKPFY